MSEQMKAGLALNLRIAELMGHTCWYRQAQGGYYVLQGDPRTSRDAAFNSSWQPVNFADVKITQLIGKPPAYSTEIAAAWKVVEKLHADGLAGGVTSYPDPMLWKAAFYEFSPIETEDFRRYAEAEASTAPHAICLAALKAVEG